MNDHVHVFVGVFASREDACAYTESQWEPEPDDSVSDEEYQAWEDRNPSWQMKADLGNPYLDSDFIETIDGPDRLNYLAKLLTEPEAIGRVRAIVGLDHNVIVLIFSEALGGFAAEMKSTPLLKYCGQFQCQL